MSKIIIAIDGYSGCGKSTLARQLAKELHYLYLDTGAMYRAITWFFLKNNVTFSNEEEVENALKRAVLEFKQEPESGANNLFLNGENIEAFIRTMEVTDKVSEVAAISSVRDFAVEEQRRMAAEKGVVMEGRDIGTVVFPDAALKIFLTADPVVRVNRRFLELQKKGEQVTREAVKENLEKRDYTDSHRKDGPLRQAKDAVVIDNSNLNPQQQLELAINLAKEKIES